jgi:hypothetical protein
LQVQAVRAELALGELELPEHASQVVAATDTEYVPAAQAVHPASPVAVL